MTLPGAPVLAGEPALAGGTELFGADGAATGGALPDAVEVSLARGWAVTVPDGGGPLGAGFDGVLAGLATTAETAPPGFGGEPATLIVTEGEMETPASRGRAGIVTAEAELIAPLVSMI